jgi:hypothetical protein
MHKLTPHDERRVAVRAGCDPRTVRARVRNLALPETERTRQDCTVVARVDEALRAEGLRTAGTSQVPQV